MTLFSLAFSEESITITTYYPSPYGSYNELTTASNTYLATNSGKVGIGTVSPGAFLDVEAPTTGGTAAIGPSATATGNRAIALGYGASVSGNDSVSIGSNFTVSGTNSVGIALANMTGTTLSASNVMSIMGGNVGIGTASPAQKLDVAGNMQANLYYDKEDTAYYLDPNATSNVYRMYVNYTPTDANDVITKQYADNNYKDPPGQWTCTLRTVATGYGCGTNVTVSCSGSEKLFETAFHRGYPGYDPYDSSYKIRWFPSATSVTYRFDHGGACDWRGVAYAICCQ